ncbi:NinX [Vibrio phage 1.052.A._10N.286.46.C3]|nr:NinX [Vibrio phage 1.052.A._10N.286.46.C3]
MNYEEMSDFELNCLLLPFWAKKEGVEIKSHGRHPALGDICNIVTFTFECEGHELSHDIHFCNDWNATMPLAVERGVTLSPSGRVELSEWEASFGLNDDLQPEIEAWQENPLRAIVICLIKVLEANQ